MGCRRKGALRLSVCVLRCQPGAGLLPPPPPPQQHVGPCRDTATRKSSPLCTPKQTVCSRAFMSDVLGACAEYITKVTRQHPARHRAIAVLRVRPRPSHAHRSGGRGDGGEDSAPLGIRGALAQTHCETPSPGRGRALPRTRLSSSFRVLGSEVPARSAVWCAPTLLCAASLPFLRPPTPAATQTTDRCCLGSVASRSMTSR